MRCLPSLVFLERGIFIRLCPFSPCFFIAAFCRLSVIDKSIFALGLVYTTDIFVYESMLCFALYFLWCF